MFTDILWRFLILATFVVGSLRNCYDDHRQKQFCTSEFVVKVRVRDDRQSKGAPLFQIDILKVFKGDLGKLIRQKRSTIQDNTVSPGSTYVVFGRRKNGNISSNMCYGEWKQTTRFYERALTRYYKRNCDCYNSTGTYSSEKRCEWEYSFMKRRGGNCKWANTMYYQRCRQELIDF